MRRSPTIVAGEAELNCWCSVCQLPTRLRVPLHINGPGTAPAGVLEICPGCGTGHDRPSVVVAASPQQKPHRHPLVALAHAAHRWLCGRRGLVPRVCAHRDCRWPGLHRHEHTIRTDEGAWRYVFCTDRHRRAWCAHNGIAYQRDWGNAE